MQAPCGIVGLGDDGATYTAKDSWDRHALKLMPLKGSWGWREHGRRDQDCTGGWYPDGAVNAVSPVIPELQVTRLRIPIRQPPSVDIYPGSDPFTEQIGFGPGNRAYNLTVRVRVRPPTTRQGRIFSTR